MRYKDVDNETISKFEVWDIPKFPLEVEQLRKRGLMCKLIILKLLLFGTILDYEFFGNVF